MARRRSRWLAFVKAPAMLVVAIVLLPLLLIGGIAYAMGPAAAAEPSTPPAPPSKPPATTSGWPDWVDTAASAGIDALRDWYNQARG